MRPILRGDGRPTRLFQSLRRCVVASLLIVAGTLSLANTAQAAPAADQLARRAVSNAYVSGTRIAPSQLKMINYYPATTPWSSMWSSYSHSTVNSDFAAIHALGANTVRVFLQPAALGYPKLTTTGASEIRDLLTTAATQGLYVQLTLFDWFGAWTNISQSKTWLDGVSAQIPDMKQIVLVELHNEMVPTDSAGLSWAKQILAYLPTDFPGVPRTMSVYGADQAAALAKLNQAIPQSANLLDVLEFHAYMSMYNVVGQLRSAITLAGGRPLLLGEAGQATTTSAQVSSEASQAAYFRTLFMVTQQLHLPPASPWTLNDFTPSALPSGMGADQAYYGLRRVDGTSKPAAAVIQNIFGSSGVSTPADSGGSSENGGWLADSSFEGEATTWNPTTSLFGAWKVTNASYATGIGMTSSTAVTGQRSAYITNAGGDSSHVPAVYQNVPLAQSGVATASASVKLVNGTGQTRITMAYFSATNGFISQTEGTFADNKATGWQRISVTATPPAGTALIQVHLKSAYNSGSAYFDDANLTIG